MTESVNHNVGRWDEKEHQLFLKFLEQYGKDWELIGKKILTRTDQQVRSHAQKYLRRLKSKREASKRGKGNISEEELKYLQIFEKPNAPNIQPHNSNDNIEVSHHIQNSISKQYDDIFSNLLTKDHDQFDFFPSLNPLTSYHPLKNLHKLGLLDDSMECSKTGWIISSYPGSLKSYQQWKNIIHQYAK